MGSEKVKKIKEKDKRDQKGRYAKGHKGGPGRPKGEPRDIVCKDGKKRSVATLIDDLLAAYETLGGDKFLKKWATHSHRNLARFIEILFKFAPQPEMLVKQEIKDFKFVLHKTITDKRPEELEAHPGSSEGLEQQIHTLRSELHARDMRLKEYSKLLDKFDIKDTVRDIPLIEHKPIKPKKDDGESSGGSDRVN